MNPHVQANATVTKQVQRLDGSVLKLQGGCDLGDNECGDMLITEIPFSLSVRSSCTCGSILPQCLFCTVLKAGEPISNTHNLPGNMRTNTL